jgi:hypothetical protein
VGGEIFHTYPDRPWVPPSLLYNGYRVFPGIKSGRGVTLTPHPLLVPRSRKGRAIFLLLLWAVRPVQSLSACTRVHFTFTLLINIIINHDIIIIIIIIIIIVIISFMQGICTYIPETNNVPREYTVAAILLLLFMVPISLVLRWLFCVFMLVLSEVCVQYQI